MALSLLLLLVSLPAGAPPPPLEEAIKKEREQKPVDFPRPIEDRPY